jgi:ferredoxin-NADP reductase
MRRAWRERVATVRRDVSMVARTLFGRRPPVVVDRGDRTSRRVASPSTAVEWRSARIVGVEYETDDAVTLVLDDPPSALGRPGQFLTVELDVDGERLRRAYSLSAASEDGPTVTVKRVERGRVSNHLNDRVRRGDAIWVRGPSGSFVWEPSERPRRHVFVAGGSGITPIHAILKAALARSRDRMLLVYGNRRARDIIFSDSLNRLVEGYPGRLDIEWVLERPPPGFEGTTGRLEPRVLSDALDAHDVGADAEFWICGPEPVRSATRALLEDRGVPAGQLHEEIFVRPVSRTDAPTPSAPQPVVVRQDGIRHELVVAPGDTLLEAGLAAGAPMPFSCAMGGCAACRVRLVDGDVMMDEPNCLTADERRDGWILTCVARPLTRCTLEVG